MMKNKIIGILNSATIRMNEWGDSAIPTTEFDKISDEIVESLNTTVVCRCCGKKLIHPEAIYGFCDTECMETFRETDR